MEKEPRRIQKPISVELPASATKILQTLKVTNKDLWAALRALDIEPPKGSHKGKAHRATVKDIAMFLELGTHLK